MIAVPIPSRPKMITVASPEYLSGRADPKAPEDLSAHNCIRYRWDSAAAAQNWTFNNGADQVETSVDGTLTVNDLDFALRAALDGVGVVQLPENSIAPCIKDGRLVRVLDGWTAQECDFFLFYSSRRHVPTKLRALIDFMKKRKLRDTDAPAAL
jgi:DNA-binding transcriptional LysR family regulator